jgi:hypothetical protein
MTGSPERRTIRTVLGGRYGLLLVTLLIVFAVNPFLGSYPWARSAVSVLTVLLIAAALSVVWAHARLFVMGLLLGGGTVLALLLSWYFDTAAAESVTAALTFWFLVLVAASLIMDIARSRQVDMNVVFGACCVYLLLGLIWAALYGLVEAAAPGSFDFGPMADGSRELARGRLTYFSFITMTTVGYGDVTPVTPPARTLAAMQGLVGQLYLAIVIARLVGLEISQRMNARG